MKKLASQVVLVLAAAYGISAQAAIQYSVADIGTLGGRTTATALNDLGQVAGYAEMADGSTQAFLSTNGQIKSLGTLGGMNSYAYALNNAGTVVGGSNVASGNALMTHAFSYSGGVMTDIAPQGAAGARSEISDINEAGRMVGRTIHPETGEQLFFFADKGQTTLVWQPFGSLFRSLSAINDAGIAAGGVGVGNQIHAITYDTRSGQIADVAGQDHWYSDARAINNNGVVVGVMSIGNWETRGFVYANGKYIDLGTGNRQFSAANDVNDAGSVVGSFFDQGIENGRAFLYSRGVVSYLDTMVDPNLTLTFTDATAINSLGQIVVTASNGHSYLLSPVPEPSTQGMLLAGLGLVSVGTLTRRSTLKRSGAPSDQIAKRSR